MKGNVMYEKNGMEDFLCGDTYFMPTNACSGDGVLNEDFFKDTMQTCSIEG